MFDFSFTEMLLVGGVALIVLGPERLPIVAKTAGSWIGKAQRFVAQVKSDIDRETELSELKRIQEEAKALALDVKDSVEKTAASIEKQAQETASQVQDVGQEIEKDVGVAMQDAKRRVQATVQKVQTTTQEDLLNIYGWGSNEPEPKYTKVETKRFRKRYHAGPSVDDLVQEIEKLRRELGMRESTQQARGAGRYSKGSRSNRPRIYR